MCTRYTVIKGRWWGHEGGHYLTVFVRAWKFWRTVLYSKQYIGTRRTRNICLFTGMPIDLLSSQQMTFRVAPSIFLGFSPRRFTKPSLLLPLLTTLSDLGAAAHLFALCSLNWLYNTNFQPSKSLMWDPCPCSPSLWLFPSGLQHPRVPQWTHTHCLGPHFPGPIWAPVQLKDLLF